MNTEDEKSSGETSIVTQRLNHLFDTVRPDGPGGRPYRNAEVVEAVNEQAGREVISRAHIGRIRSGERPNPSHVVVVALAQFFGVPVDYFSDSDTAERVDGQLELAKALQDTGIARMATRAAGLSPESLRTIMAVVEAERARAQLPDEKP